MIGTNNATAVSTPPLQRIAGTNVSVLRLDCLDEIGSGNKSFKLKYNLERAREEGYRRLISLGGAWSNHIHALALIGNHYDFDTVGLIRGERQDPLNETLSDAVAAGMELHFLSRSEYRQRNEQEFIRQWQARFPDCYWIPEGASNTLGVRGCMEIADYADPESELIIVPCATASTLAGLSAGAPDREIVGVSVLKGAEDLRERVMACHVNLLREGYIDHMPENWSIVHDFHCGGYARLDARLAAFLHHFQRDSDIPIEPVYSGKMFFAINQLINTGQIRSSTRITAIHTGGMQGLRGMRAKLQRYVSSQHESAETFAGLTGTYS